MQGAGDWAVWLTCLRGAWTARRPLAGQKPDMPPNSFMQVGTLHPKGCCLNGSQLGTGQQGEQMAQLIQLWLL